MTPGLRPEHLDIVNLVTFCCMEGPTMGTTIRDLIEGGFSIDEPLVVRRHDGDDTAYDVTPSQRNADQPGNAGLIVLDIDDAFTTLADEADEDDGDDDPDVKTYLIITAGGGVLGSLEARDDDDATRKAQEQGYAVGEIMDPDNDSNYDAVIVVTLK